MIRQSQVRTSLGREVPVPYGSKQKSLYKKGLVVVFGGSVIILPDATYLRVWSLFCRRVLDSNADLRLFEPDKPELAIFTQFPYETTETARGKQNIAISYAFLPLCKNQKKE